MATIPERRVKPDRLKVRIPHCFEAEGEGYLPVLLVAGLCVFVLVLGFAGFARWLY
jgi:hypothetical protein